MARKTRRQTETAVYVLLIVCTAFSFWQAAQMRVTVPERLSGSRVVLNEASPASKA